jgi:hypothetical protein
MGAEQPLLNRGHSNRRDKQQQSDVFVVFPIGCNVRDTIQTHCVLTVSYETQSYMLVQSVDGQ